MLLSELKNYVGHAAVRVDNNKVIKFPVYVKGENTMILAYIGICPFCKENSKLKHANWYESKVRDERLKFKCDNCGYSDFIENLEVVPFEENVYESE